MVLVKEDLNYQQHSDSPIHIEWSSGWWMNPGSQLQFVMPVLISAGGITNTNGCEKAKIKLRLIDGLID